MTKARQLGRIEITTDLFAGELNSLNMDSLKTLFSVFFPVHIAKNEYRRTAMYVGISDRFDLVNEGELIPLYRTIATTHVVEDGLAVYYSIKFEKVEDEDKCWRFV